MLCFFLLVPLLILVSQEEGLTNLKPTTKKTETSHNPQPKTKAILTFEIHEKKIRAQICESRRNPAVLQSVERERVGGAAEF